MFRGYGAFGHYCVQASVTMCNVGGLARDTTRLILMIQLQSRDNKRPSNVLNKAYLLHLPSFKGSKTKSKSIKNL